MQELLDKVVPELKELDEIKEVEFYKKRGIELKETIVEHKDSEANSTTSNMPTTGTKQPQLAQTDNPNVNEQSHHNGYQKSLPSRGAGDDKYTSVPVSLILS